MSYNVERDVKHQIIVYLFVFLKIVLWVADSVGPIQMSFSVALDLGLHCCSGLSVQILKVNMVCQEKEEEK